MAALGLPQETQEQKAARHTALQAGLLKAIEVPLRAMRTADGCWEAMAAMASHGNLASRSDLEVGARALDTGIWGCYRNVLINAASLADASLREKVETEAKALADRAAARLKDVMAALDARG
jgi:glutamate formiminotransferase/formiminotetrahydrofolate cyclodeaminase